MSHFALPLVNKGRINVVYRIISIPFSLHWRVLIDRFWIPSPSLRYRGFHISKQFHSLESRRILPMGGLLSAELKIKGWLLCGRLSLVCVCVSEL
jgi:hypothetical protein